MWHFVTFYQISLQYIQLCLKKYLHSKSQGCMLRSWKGKGTKAFSSWHFKGIKAITRGHGGNHLCCLREVSGLKSEKARDQLLNLLSRNILNTEVYCLAGTGYQVKFHSVFKTRPSNNQDSNQLSDESAIRTWFWCSNQLSQDEETSILCKNTVSMKCKICGDFSHTSQRDNKNQRQSVPVFLWWWLYAPAG